MNSMKDTIDINYKSCICNIIQKEIAYKGKGYIILKKIQPEFCREVIEYAAEQLSAMGAEMIYLTCSDKEVVLSDKVLKTKNFEFRYDSDIDYLERKISSADDFVEYEDLLFKGLSTENGQDFLCTYNECFFEVPNSGTYTDIDIDRLMNDTVHCRAGLILQKDKVIGIYEISLEDDLPEIASIGIIKEKRGQRLGRKSLNFLIGFLSRSGYKRVCLKISTKNPNAYKLYLQMGFCKKRTLSRWYLQKHKE
jgi:ribosomal protein S18 acetylase RimI-like enzyme